MGCIREKIKGKQTRKYCANGLSIPLSKASYRDCQLQLISYGPLG